MYRDTLTRPIRLELGHYPPMGPNAHRSGSISDVSSVSTVSVLSFDPIRVRALYVEEPLLRCISSTAARTVLQTSEE